MNLTRILKPAAIAVSIALLITGCGSGKPASTTDATALLTEMQKAINADCSTSGVRTCLKTRLGFAYPGSLDTAKSLACIEAMEEDSKFHYNLTFDTLSLAEVSDWKAGADAKATDWTFAGKAPEGTVFTVKLREIVVAHNIESTNNISGHVAVQDGHVYWFPSFCGT